MYFDDNISRAEVARTGNYGYDYDNTVEKRRCPICGAISPEFMYENSENRFVGCSECIKEKYTFDYDDDEFERRC